MNTRIKILFISYCNNLIFYAPIALLVRSTEGISANQFLILQVLLSVSIFLTEIPSGLLEVIFDYKTIIVFSQIMIIIARIVLFLSHNFFLFAIEAILEGISNSLWSGSYESYIYILFNKEQYVEINSKIKRISNVGFFSSIAIFPLLNYALSIKQLIILTCISNVLGLFIIFSLPRDKFIRNKKTKNIVKWKNVKKREIMLFILEFSCLSISSLAINYFYIIKLLDLSFKEEIISGVILIYSIIEMFSVNILKHISFQYYKKIIIILFFCLGVCFAAIYYIKSILIVCLMMILPLVIDVSICILDGLANEYIDSIGKQNNRSTLLSIFNLGNSGYEIVFLFVASMIVDKEGLKIFLIISLFIFNVLLVTILYKNNEGI